MQTFDVKMIHIVEASINPCLKKKTRRMKEKNTNVPNGAREVVKTI